MMSDEILGITPVIWNSNSYHGNLTIPSHLHWKILSALIPGTSLSGT